MRDPGNEAEKNARTICKVHATDMKQIVTFYNMQLSFRTAETWI